MVPNKKIRKPKHRGAKCSSTDDVSKNTPFFQRLAGLLSLGRQCIIDFGLISILVIGFVLIIREVIRPEIILFPIEVPEDIAKSGYTGNVVAEQLADAALNIGLETRKLSTQTSWHKVAENSPEILMNDYIQDITVPGATFSIRTISRFVRQELGLPMTYLRGDLVHEKDGLGLTLRILSTDKVPALHIFQKDKRVEQLIQDGGASLLRLTSPSILAIHAYHKFNVNDSAMREEDYKQLVPFFEYCLSYQPATDDTLAIYLWGAALINLNRPEEAIKQFQKAIEFDPTYIYSYNGWGNALRDLKRPKEAIKQYQKGVELDPKFAGAYYNWGNALQDLKRPEEAIKQFQKTVELEPKFANAYYNWGKALRDLKRPEEAIKQYQKAVELDPKLAGAYYNWGNAFRDLKRPKEAIKQFQKAVELDPKFAGTYNDWGKALQDLKRFEEAIKQYQKAVELDPKLAGAYYNWGNALRDLKRPEEANEKFSKARGNWK